VRSYVLVLIPVLCVGCAQGRPVEAAEPVAVDVPPVPEDPDEPAPTLAPFDAKAFLAGYAATRTGVLSPIPSDRAELDERLRTERDPLAKRALARASVIAHLADALEASDAATLAAERRAMTSSLRIARRGTRDARLLAELAFASAYLSFQTDAPDATRLADEFFMRHVVDRELLRMITMMRAELAFGRHDLSTARAIFALLLGDGTDPLHAYALYRTAATYCGEADAPTAQSPQATATATAPANTRGGAAGRTTPAASVTPAASATPATPAASATPATPAASATPAPAAPAAPEMSNADACRAALERSRLNGCDPTAPAEARELGERAYEELGAAPIERRERDRQAPRYCARTDTDRFRDPLFGR